MDKAEGRVKSNQPLKITETLAGGPLYHVYTKKSAWKFSRNPFSSINSTITADLVDALKRLSGH